LMKLNLSRKVELEVTFLSLLTKGWKLFRKRSAGNGLALPAGR
jgi:hypothetical protein